MTLSPTAVPLAKAKRSRRPPVSIPPELQAMVRHFAQELIGRHGDELKDPNAKSRVSALLRRYLPPHPRRSGRRGLASVTAAIRWHAELKQSCPERPAKEIWRQIYRAVIPGWDALPVIERRLEADQLHRRVRWRRAMAARRLARRTVADNSKK